MIARVTEHAKEMAKLRLGWNEGAVERMADKALNEGVEHGKTRGRLNRYVSGLFLAHRTANNIRLYGEHVFIFIGGTLITVFQLPNNLRKAARDAAAKNFSTFQPTQPLN